MLNVYLINTLFASSIGSIPEYIKPNEKKMQNMRRYAKLDEDGNNMILKKSVEANPTYDAFEKDIAVVNFYFARPTVTQFKRDQRLTWMDYIAQIGGLLGLAMGFSIISAIEIFYWMTIRLSRNIFAASGSKKGNKVWASPRNNSAKEKHDKVVALKNEKDC